MNTLLYICTYTIKTNRMIVAGRRDVRDFILRCNVYFCHSLCKVSMTLFHFNMYLPKMKLLGRHTDFIMSGYLFVSLYLICLSGLTKEPSQYYSTVKTAFYIA